MTDAASSSPLGGIYAITNTINGKQYIGSSVNIAQRWQTHRTTLNSGKHHTRHLQAAWNKYGANAFTFTVLEYVADLSNLVAREQFYLDARLAAKGSTEYNMRTHAENNLHVRHTPETRARMSAIARGKPKSLKARARLSAMMKGVFTEAQRQALAKAIEVNRGKPRSAETRAKIGAANRGRRWTDEQRAKTIEAKTGLKQSPETIAKRVAKNTGKKRTPETRAKMSEAAMRRWGNRNRKPATITQPFLWPDET